MTQPTPAQQSAMSTLIDTLDGYGLGTLGQWAWDAYINGSPIEQIMLDMRDRPEYQARFPALAALRQQGRGISEAEYIQQENSYRTVMHSYGLPTGFYDQPDDFATLMTGDVSPQELQSRVSSYSQAVLSDTETLNAMRSFYLDAGVPDRNPEADLLAYYLDPNKAAPLLEEQFQAAQFAGAAARSGYGTISRDVAEQYGARQDITADQAAQGFGALYQNRELFTALPGQREDEISQQVQLGAAFGGDAAAQETIEKRRRERVAAGQGGGGFSQTQRGVSGLGSQRV